MALEYVGHLSYLLDLEATFTNCWPFGYNINCMIFDITNIRCELMLSVAILLAISYVDYILYVFMN